MTALVTVETILLILLTVLVAGLLRSHAEILRRLHEVDHAGESAVAVSADLPRPEDARSGSIEAFDVAGTTLRGDAVKVAMRGVGRDTLLAFLSSGCAPCRTFWAGLASETPPRIPGGARIVVVTKDPAFESPSRLAELAAPGVPVVLSSAAWEAYAVKGSPYFIHVDGTRGVVRGEGTATEWDQVISLVRDAFADVANGDSSPERLRRADRELRAAGIGPGHPSLYGRSDDERTIDVP